MSDEKILKNLTRQLNRIESNVEQIKTLLDYDVLAVVTDVEMSINTETGEEVDTYTRGMEEIEGCFAAIRTAFNEIR